MLRVWTDVGAKKPIALLARIVSEKGKKIKIVYLSEGEDGLYSYEKDIYEIENSSIASRLGDRTEQDLGYKPVEGGWLLGECEEEHEYDTEDEEEFETEEDTDVSCDEEVEYSSEDDCNGD